MDEELQKILKHLRLGGLLAQWDELLTQARRGRFSHERLLQHVLEAEYRVKVEHARLLRRKRAHIPEMLEIVPRRSGLADFAGTTDSSDFLLVFMSDVPPEAFSDALQFPKTLSPGGGV